MKAGVRGAPRPGLFRGEAEIGRANTFDLVSHTKEKNLKLVPQNRRKVKVMEKTRGTEIKNE